MDWGRRGADQLRRPGGSRARPSRAYALPDPPGCCRSWPSCRRPRRSQCRSSARSVRTPSHSGAPASAVDRQPRPGRRPVAARPGRARRAGVEPRVVAARADPGSETRGAGLTARADPVDRRRAGKGVGEAPEGATDSDAPGNSPGQAHRAEGPHAAARDHPGAQTRGEAEAEATDGREGGARVRLAPLPGRGVLPVLSPARREDDLPGSDSQTDRRSAGSSHRPVPGHLPGARAAGDSE